jgi:ribosomal RNA-processing protein 17
LQGIRDNARGEDSPLRLEEEYVDEDRHTTVTVEAVDVTRDGFQGARTVGFEDTSDEDGRETHATESNPADISNGRARPGGVPRGKVTKPSKGSTPKPKKKFRYLSKRENKMERVKIKAKNSAKAKARKG